MWLLTIDPELLADFNVSLVVSADDDETIGVNPGPRVS